MIDSLNGLARVCITANSIFVKCLDLWCTFNHKNHENVHSMNNNGRTVHAVYIWSYAY